MLLLEIIDSWHIHALELKIEKKYSKAISFYKKAADLGLPQELMDTYYFNLSVCYMGVADYKKAVNNLQKCLDINPEYESAKELLNMATEASQRGETAPSGIDL